MTDTVITDQFGNTAWTGERDAANEALAKLQSQVPTMKFKIQEKNMPNPPAGFINNNQLPAPPVPQVPGANLPQPKPPTPATGASRQTRAAAEPVAEISHILLAGAGWIPFMADTLSIKPEDLLATDPNEQVMFMDKERNQINCRVSAILGLKTRYRVPK